VVEEPPRIPEHARFNNNAQNNEQEQKNPSDPSCENNNHEKRRCTFAEGTMHCQIVYPTNEVDFAESHNVKIQGQTYLANMSFEDGKSWNYLHSYLELQLWEHLVPEHLCAQGAYTVRTHVLSPFRKYTFSESERGTKIVLFFYPPEEREDDRKVKTTDLIQLSVEYKTDAMQKYIYNADYCVCPDGNICECTKNKDTELNTIIEFPKRNAEAT
jgi:hypothetical protein